MVASKKLSAEQVAKLVSRYQSGEPLAQIVEDFGVSRETGRKYLRDQGVATGDNREEISKYLPWSPRQQHRSNYMYKVALRALVVTEKKKFEGQLEQADPGMVKAAEQLVAYLDGDNPRGVPLAVDYDPNQGFSIRPRRPGEGILTGGPLGPFN